MGTARVIDSRAGSIRNGVWSIFAPRLWKIMIAAAYPFFLLTAKYFEALESTGSVAAFIADVLFPVTLIAYAALIFVLKKRAI